MRSSFDLGFHVPYWILQVFNGHNSVGASESIGVLALVQDKSTLF